MRRGEIRWYTFALPDKRRPVLLLAREAVVDTLNEIVVAPATRTIRGLATEVVLTPDDGIPAVGGSLCKYRPPVVIGSRTSASW